MIEPSSDRQKWRAFAAVAAAQMAGVISLTGIFLALSPIAEDFGVTLRQVSWVVIIQSLTAFFLLSDSPSAASAWF